MDVADKDPTERFVLLIKALKKMADDPSDQASEEAVQEFRGMVEELKEEMQSDARATVMHNFAELQRFLLRWLWDYRKQAIWGFKKRLREAEIKDLIWGVKRLLGIVRAPLGKVKPPPWMRRWHGATLREERHLDAALQFQRRVMAHHSEEGMRPMRRYFGMVLPFSAGRSDGKKIEILSKEEALAAERETMARATQETGGGQWTFREDAEGQVVEAAPADASEGGEPQADE
jgi:hypothetical protein